MQIRTGFPGIRLALSAIAAGTLALPAEAQGLLVKVTPQADCREIPLSIVVPSDQFLKAAKGSSKAGIEAPVQAESVGNNQVRLTWIARNLKKGETQTYRLNGGQPAVSIPGVVATESDGNIAFTSDGKLLTRYNTTTGPTKPYFYPLMAPTGKPVTRHWPVEQAENETNDHPHHRGLWFTHGMMNGIDFWTETGDKKGKTIDRRHDYNGGSIYGILQTTTDWVGPDGKKIAEDRREAHIYPLSNGWLLDWTITIKPLGGPLVWGDTKEGTFALRMADVLRAEKKDKPVPGTGMIVNSAGQTQDDAWGKSAAWCDYYGTLDGETVGVAIFDDPKNPRYPTTWHVRSYGLFAANPFGLHDFDPAKKNDPKAGELTTPENGETTFRYRVYIHKGDTATAGIAGVGANIATPPTIVVGS